VSSLANTFGHFVWGLFCVELVSQTGIFQLVLRNLMAPCWKFLEIRNYGSLRNVSSLANTFIILRVVPFVWGFFCVVRVSQKGIFQL
jgi:hypothetical protein